MRSGERVAKKKGGQEVCESDGVKEWMTGRTFDQKSKEETNLGK